MSQGVQSRKQNSDPVFCQHYKCSVSHPTFYHHKTKYYNAADSRWAEVGESDHDLDSEVEIDVLPCTSAEDIPIDSPDSEWVTAGRSVCIYTALACQWCF